MERQNEIEPDKIYVQMFGSFRMTYQGQQIQLGKWLSAKMIHLLLLLICRRGEGVTRSELIWRLYGADENDSQSSNSLRAMIFRLRRSIQESGLPEGEYISTKGGRYTWNNQPLETELDVETFQKLVKAGFEEIDPVHRVELLTAACKTCSGDFMPDMVSDEWVGKTSWRFRELYMRALRELTSQLKSQKRYAELLEDCELVLKRYPSEEWQCMKLESLNDMKRYREAVEYYEALETEARQTCTPFLSQDLKEQYLKAKNMMQYEVVEMEQIQKDLMPMLLKPGATSCEYLEFVDIYQFMMRVFAREGISSQLLLLTLVGPQGAELESSGMLEGARSSLESAIQKTIRCSDLYTRYGSDQFLVLLASTGQQGGEAARERIQERYCAINRNPQITLRCELRDICSDEL